LRLRRQTRSLGGFDQSKRIHFETRFPISTIRRGKIEVFSESLGFRGGLKRKVLGQI
jgi:hypothetical protein